MTPPTPQLEFEYFIAPESLEPALGLTVGELNNLAAKCDSGVAYTSNLLQVRGKLRQVDVPSRDLDDVQRDIAALLFPVDTAMNASAHGYIAGRSTRTNALPHVGARHLQKMDIEEFFGSITAGQVVTALVGSGFGRGAAILLSRLVTCQGVLPLGSRTSPRVSNLVLRPFDDAMVGLATPRSLVYTRYADDLTFSGAGHVELRHEVEAELGRLGFRLKEAKTKNFKRGQPMFVTGLSVADDEGPRVRKRVKRALRQQLHYIERFGFQDHASRVHAHPMWMSGNLSGQLHYLRFIEPTTVERLARQYPKAFAILMPDRPDTRAERGRQLRLELLKRVDLAPPQNLPAYVPSVSI